MRVVSNLQKANIRLWDLLHNSLWTAVGEDCNGIDYSRLSHLMINGFYLTFEYSTIFEHI